MKANEQWRNDPERRVAARKLNSVRYQAVSDAQAHLKAAYDALNSVSRWPNPSYEYESPQDTMIGRIRSHTHAAIFDVDRYMSVAHSSPGETYIGNMAAFGEGLFE